MKKITLLAIVLLGVEFATAQRPHHHLGNNNTGVMSFDEPIAFIERGIEFFVFPNGEFDFNTRPGDSEGTFFYRNAGRRVNVEARVPMNYGVLVQFDSFGRIRRVGNTFINYDNRDRVNRIGSVFMQYNRWGLTHVGGLHIIYNHHGQIVRTMGSIKGWSNNGFAYTDNSCTDGNVYYAQPTVYNYYYRNNSVRK